MTLTQIALEYARGELVLPNAVVEAAVFKDGDALVLIDPKSSDDLFAIWVMTDGEVEDDSIPVWEFDRQFELAYGRPRTARSRRTQ